MITIPARPAAAVLAVAALTLSACGSGGSGRPGSTAGMSMSPGMSMSSGMPMSSSSVAASPAATGPHNAADVRFATDMIPHHRQAVEMAGMVPSRTTNTAVRSIATTIAGAQTPEIASMTGWLRGWHEPVPSSMKGMAMSGHAQGMMSDAAMSRLATLSGTAFDRTWLTMMITHHQGAITMSDTELRDGSNGDAEALARSIISSQRGQITRMRSIVDGLPGR